MGSDFGSLNVSGASLRLAQAYGVQPPRATPAVASTFQGSLQTTEGVTTAPALAGTTQSRAREVMDTVSLASASIDQAKAAELRAEIGWTLSAAKLDVGIEPTTGMPVPRADQGNGAIAPNTAASTAATLSGLAVNARPSSSVLPRTPATVLAMYQKPADQNAAATGVALGRHIDFNG